MSLFNNIIPGWMLRRDKRSTWYVGKHIIKNRVRCLKCDTVIESVHRWDFKYCPCSSVFVDGGKSYLRRGWPEGHAEDWFAELSEYLEEDQLRETK